MDMASSPELPVRFPCWVKAIYSWGGESKQDLGFMEGDLIECLNAGDGMWWMGRLRRDRRMIGLFPSNFVKVLDDDFKPAPHRSSPMSPLSANSSRSNSQTISGPVTPSPSKGLFRKPFTAYAMAASPNPEAAARDLRASPAGSLTTKTKPKTKPYSSMHVSKHAPYPQQQLPKPRAPSPTIPAPIARASSPLPPRDPNPHVRPHSRAPSPAPYNDRHRQPSPSPHHHHHNYQYDRQPSPAPYDTHSRQPSPSPLYGNYSRQPSPAPVEYEDDYNSSPPPPPPPAHRIAYTRHATPEPQASPLDESAYTQTHRQLRTPSPAPSDQRSGFGGFTPSPLRDAMNDVMTSLEGMSVSHHAEPEQHDQRLEPVNPWSPEAFNEMYNDDRRNRRPHTALGMQRPSHEIEEEHGERDGRPQHAAEFESYVERMENRLAHAQGWQQDTNGQGHQETSPPPAVPAKSGFSWSRPASAFGSRPGTSQTEWSRPGSSYATSQVGPGRSDTKQGLRSRKSAFELGRERLNRTFTTKSSVTNASSTAQSTSTNNSNSTQMTSQSLMSGYSAGGFSATSAGSLARRKFGRHPSTREQRPMSVMGLQNHTSSSMSGISYHSSHASNPQSNQDRSLYHASSSVQDSGGALGGLSTPYGAAAAAGKKRGFLGKIVASVKTGAANARSNMSTTSSSRPSSRQSNFNAQGISSASYEPPGKSAASDMGLGGTGDWVQMRRDVNRSNSLSRNERSDRIERCQMADIPILTPVDTLNNTVEGDEGADGTPIAYPTDIASCNFSMVDKSARFVNNLPALINAASLAQGYLCRPYKSDVQRLRAIFVWVAERVTWEEDFEGDVDTRRVIQSRRGCSEEIAVLVAEMCSAIGVHAEVVRGHLKIPGELSLTEDLLDAAARPNHWWNAVIVDEEWRIMDCSLANPSNPRRAMYSSAGSQMAETWWFLARPMQFCYTHVPLLPEQQHIVPPVTHDILMALPISCPPFFKNQIQMWDFDTSLVNLEGLEMAHIQLSVPDDVECTATVSARSFARDADGDFFESGESMTKRALAQGDFISCEGGAGPFKRYTIKAFVPSSPNATNLETQSISNAATLNIYAGRRGLTHSINSNPHPLALSLPLVHNSGPNPDFEFFTRHPTPHALRHELYVTGPLCRRLVLNNTFVFAVRQHPASANWQSVEKRPVSPRPGSAMSIARPGSAMSMASVSMSGSAYSNPSNSGSDQSNQPPLGAGSQPGQQKPAKLAIQSPSGKILRMTRKAEGRGGAASGIGSRNADLDGVVRVGTNWETIIKIGEKGTWRGLVLADRSARWCVFGEWECI